MTENLRNRIYRLLVNRIPGIRARYLKMRQDSCGACGETLVFCGACVVEFQLVFPEAQRSALSGELWIL